MDAATALRLNRDHVLRRRLRCENDEYICGSMDGVYLVERADKRGIRFESRVVDAVSGCDASADVDCGWKRVAAQLIEERGRPVAMAIRALDEKHFRATMALFRMREGPEKEAAKAVVDRIYASRAALVSATTPRS